MFFIRELEAGKKTDKKPPTNIAAYKTAACIIQQRHNIYESWFDDRRLFHTAQRSSVLEKLTLLQVDSTVCYEDANS